MVYYSPRCLCFVITLSLLQAVKLLLSSDNNRHTPVAEPCAAKGIYRLHYAYMLLRLVGAGMVAWMHILSVFLA